MICNFFVMLCFIYTIGFVYKTCSTIKDYEDKNKVTVPQMVKKKGKSVEEQFIEFYNYIKDRDKKEYE